MHTAWCGAKLGATLGLFSTLPFVFSRNKRIIIPRCTTGGFFAGGLFTTLWSYYQVSQNHLHKDLYYLKAYALKTDRVLRQWDITALGGTITAGGLLWYYLPRLGALNAATIGLATGTLIFILNFRRAPLYVVQNVWIREEQP
mmetsp:Transcript_10173/g.37845  ORF Transcript_10173/g.37845 Transcript_10173/m.37845 type:complete len:143 (-) Transcript_10173:358-786(-)